MQSNGKITKRDVDALKPSATDQFLWEAGDGAVKGFAVKVTPKGKKTFIFQYRLGGRGSPTKRVQIGEQGMLIADARAEAERLRQGVRRGVPPSTTRARDKAKLVSGLVDSYLAYQREQGIRTVDEIEAMMKRDILPAWGARSIASITIDDVEDLVELKKRSAPVQANRVLAWIKGMFTYAVKKRILSASPAFAVDPVTPENSRTRVLSDQEIVEIWNAAARRPGAFASATHFLFLTGQRESEVGELPRSEIKLQERLWDMPADRAKNKLEHVVHLSDLAIKILESAPNLSKRFWFSTNGTSHIKGWAKWKEQLDIELCQPPADWAPPPADETLQISNKSLRASQGKDVRLIAKGHAPFSKMDLGRAVGIRHGERWGHARITEIVSGTEAKVRVLAAFASTEPSSEWLMGMDHWTIHDFRRAMATHLNKMKFAENVVDRILNHRNKSANARTIVKKIYNRYDYFEERKAAIEAWSRYIQGLLTGQGALSNVVQISERKG